jgi:N-acetylmuramic acid 6-phosphate etherase
VYVTTNPRDRVEIEVDVLIAPVVGPEVLMGSTRMKSATAQKMVLNMISTAAMVRLGKVYENMMVDLVATSRKLEERSLRVLMVATGLSYAGAKETLAAAGGNVKRAIVMTLAGVGREAADGALLAAGGLTRDALRRLGR